MSLIDMAKTVSFDINLKPKDPFFRTPIGKLLKWALSVGRYIVIFTELIVIISFVSRFTLDRQITDLNNTISQRRNVIESFGTLELDIRKAQLQISTFKEFEQQSNIVDVFPALTEITPEGISLKQLTIRPEAVSLTGTTFSQQALNTYITNLTLSSAFTNVEIGRIETDNQQDEGFLFVISATTNVGNQVTR